MLRRGLFSSMIFISVLLTFAAGVLSGSIEDLQDTYKGGPGTFSPVSSIDWKGWDGDLDRDRVHDLLEGDLHVLDGTGEKIGINLHLEHQPTEGEVSNILRYLENSGARPVLHGVGKYTTAVYLSMDRVNTRIMDLASLPDVTMVEYRPVMRNFLDVSSPATRSRDSTLYSPESVRDLGYTGEGTVVAVIDSGADNTVHESLRGKYIYGVDFTGTTIVYGLDPDDIDGHGTHVTGTVMGTGGQSGTYMGTAPGADLVDLRYAKIQGDFTGSADRALEWVIENHREYDIRVVSCSWGSTVTTSGRDTTSTLVNRLVDEGVVVVVAAGNDGEEGLPSPASADKAITVGALTDRSTVERSDDTVELYSNRGPRASDGDLDVMDELKPDIVAPGTNIRAPKHNSVRDYVDMTGTSMATPHISGIVALILEANPDLTPTQVKSILRDTAQQQAGASVPQTDPKYNYRWGWGMVDAYGAVKRAMDLRSTEMEAPDNVRMNDEVRVSVSGIFTKTPYDIQSDDLVIELRTPIEWGMPTDSEIYTDSPTATGLLSTPVIIGGEWVVRGMATYNHTLNSVNPALSASIRPLGRVGDTRSLHGVLYINGMGGLEVEQNATISYDSDPPDLSITPLSIWFSDALPESGDEVQITARVNNTGSKDASDVIIRFIDGPLRSGRTIGEDTIDISGGDHGIARVTWEANPGVHAITVIADPGDEIEESNEDNNTAERPLTVIGLNPPPIAQLEVTPGSGTTTTRFNLDGTGSSDTNIRGGSVVEYNFDFGDGEGTGWVDDPAVTHVYREGGTYRASLVVRDNGGAESGNDAGVGINVTPVISEEIDLFFNSSYGLSPEPGPSAPIDVQVSSIPVDSGTWESSPVENTLVLHSGVMVDLAIKAERPSIVSIEVEIIEQDNGFSELTRFSHPGGSVNRTAGITVLMDEMRIPFGSSISLRLSMCSNLSGVEFWTGSSSVARVPFYLEENLPPIASAGEDLDVKAGNKVEFSGTGSDPDGEIIHVRWDVDSDGNWEHEGENAFTFEYSGYGEEGQYTALMEIQDDDGYTSSDTLNVLVRSRDHNYPPDVTMDCPSAPLTGSALVTGTSSDDQFVEYVEVMLEGDESEIPWTQARGKEVWRLEMDTGAVRNGPYILKARAFDGERYSTIAACDVEVFNPNSSPTIERVIAAPVPLPLDGDTPLRITAEVDDPDLPSDEVLVSIDLAPIGGPGQLYLADDGIAPDTREGDGVYTVSYIPSTSTPTGEFELTLNVVDSAGESDEAMVTVEIVSRAGIDISLSTSDVEAGGKLLVEVRVESEVDIASVMIYLPGILDEGGFELKDDGKGGDRIAEDEVFTGEVKIDAAPGIYTFEVRVLSNAGSMIASDTFTISVRETPQGSDANDNLLLFVIIGGAIPVSLLMIIFMVTLQRRGRVGSNAGYEVYAYGPVLQNDHPEHNAFEFPVEREGPPEVVLASIIEE